MNEAVCPVETEDFLGQWIEERVQIRVEHFVRGPDLINDWGHWLRDNGISGGPEFVARSFYRALEERGFTRQARDGAWGFRHVALKAAGEDA